jgi:hypothetical protein
LNSFVRVESSGEFITVINTEYSRIEFQVHGKLKVRPVEAFSRLSILGNFMTLKENSLRESCVLLSIFD